MIHTKKETKKIITKKVMKKNEPKPKLPAAEKMEDVQRLVHLLQVHQVELEHQNQELRITQQELEVSRNKYVNLFDFSPTPYLTLDFGGIIKEVNLSASKLFGIDRNKLIGRRFISYILQEDRDIFNSFIKTVFKSPTKHSCDLKVMNKNKQVFHVLVEGLELEDTLESDQRCQVSLIDLTEFKRLEASLKKSNEELKILNTTKDKFFSIIAQDLRSPLAVLNYSDLLATKFETLSQEEIVQFSRSLNEILNNLYGLLENLLHWSLLQKDMLPNKPENLKLSDVINKIIKKLNQDAKEKNIIISNDIDKETLVYADADMLHSIVQNLIVNAIKFTPTGGRVTVSSADKDGFIEVSVLDNGIGIDHAASPKLFSFNELYTTNGTNGEKGTGLGLPLCKEFVERNDGKIWFESELGKGSKFIFTLRKSQK